MTGKTVLITGATNGIGQEAALALAAMGADVILVARDRSRGEATLRAVRAAGPGRHELFLADLASQAEVRTLAAGFRREHERLDVLINNAGGVFGERRVTADGLEMTFALNHLAYFLLTDLLLDTLKASAPARVINVSSGAEASGKIDFSDLQGKRYAPFRAYSQSKLANVLFTFELARRLAGSGVTANCLHPGFVASGFGGEFRGAMALVMRLIRPLAMSPKRGAETIVYLASSPEVEGVTGRYFVNRKAVPSSKRSLDSDIAGRLWRASQELTQAPT